MKRLIDCFLLFLTILLALPKLAFAVASPPCTTPLSTTQGNLCIIEVQTIGASGDESEDFVIITNATALPFTQTNIRLQYVNSLGILDSSLSTGTFAAGETKVFASSTLKTLNSSANNLPLPLASSGGSLRLVRLASSTSSTITATYDQISWGTSVALEGSPVPEQTAGSTITRRENTGILQDSGDNATDFEALPLACKGSEFNEIQPFVTDELGQSIDVWLELKGTVNPESDCLLVTSSDDLYVIPAIDLPLPDELKIINRGLDSQNNIVPLHIGEISGQVWLADTSQYGGPAALKLPINTSSYSSLIKGQTWALIDNAWRRTYKQTPEEPNIYQAEPAVISQDDPTACETVLITELLPNPLGEDTDKEWVELYNNNDSPAGLGSCMVSISGSEYHFLADDVLGPGEFRSLSSLFTSEGSDKPLSLRNTDETLVALLRKRADGSSDTIQSFVYSNAPENQSWARFDDGWHWTYILTPSAENILQETPLIPEQTEFAADTNKGGPEESETTPTVTTLQITELLPNPASPQTDENDEFIEIFNSGTEPVNLDGYKVQTGSNYTYSFTIDNLSIPAGGYVVLTSGATGLTLSNTAGRARLLDPAGNVLSETDPYEDAEEDATWAYIDSKWQWTGSPTSGAANTFTAPTVAGITKTKTTKKTTATKKTSTAKPKAISSTKTTKPKETAASTTTSDQAPKAPLHVSIIALVGGLALLYGAYEYRGDLANALYRFKRNRAARRENRAKS